ncbi:MAG: tetratricopeptide repeat protein [Candidatus Cloacimonetes bacterium]|nr:tetratricopeptide repeat protein [Candidatus Cloacimonadota bacterium]MCF8393994.1 tetratricopeptide repeat protein [Melioribacteraceae bacterium]
MSQTKSHLPFLYNPAGFTKSELIENFVVRHHEFDQIFDVIKKDKMQNPPQHIIIQGQRGTGKTTLLLRLSYAIKDDPGLNKWLIPVVSDEESWGISTLAEFWIHIAEDLEGINDEFLGIADEIEEHEEEDNFEEKCFEILQKKLLSYGKKLVFFIDNFGDLVKKFSKKEHQRLREVLLTSSNIRLVAASSVVLEFTYEYSEPFYEFFKVVKLKSLKKQEAENLLLKLGESYKAKEVKEIIKNNPQRVEALRRITNGIPRTIVLLYEIFIDNETGNAFRDLELTLDRVTPLYKHRMDDLKPEPQKIVNILALNWDAMSVKEIAAKTKITSKHVSAQLSYLEKSGVVTKERTSTKNNFYYLSERFFNIWYLMRRGRKKHKNKVRFLVEFLELWCTPQRLSDVVSQLKEGMQKGTVYEKHALYMTEALAYTSIEPAEHHSLIEETREYLKAKESELINELSPSDVEVYVEVINLIKENKEKKALQKAGEIKHKIHETNLLIGIIYAWEIKNYEKAEEYYLKAIDNGHAGAMYNLANMYSERKEYEKAEEYYLKAIENGHAGAMNNLAYMYYKRKERKKEALEFANNSTLIEKRFTNLHTLVMVLLWNDEIELAVNTWKAELFKEEYIVKLVKEISEIFNFFIAKKQYNFIYKLFQENEFEIKERYKPIYFALLHFMGSKYEMEKKKMGPELKETVDEVISVIKQLEKDYK